jgi:DNA-directed RNA polymerase subunit RPC12/RpoP
MQSLVCAFCGKTTVPKADRTQSLVKYRCDNCYSLIAAYASKFETDLQGGTLFSKYSLDKYSPKVPEYVKSKKTGSD